MSTHLTITFIARDTALAGLRGSPVAGIRGRRHEY